MARSQLSGTGQHNGSKMSFALYEMPLGVVASHRFLYDLCAFDELAVLVAAVRRRSDG